MESNSQSALQPDRAVGEDDPLDIQALVDVAPWWPFGRHTTYRLVRSGELRAIAIGRRRYVTLALLRECLQRHTVKAEAAR
jgi:hypothetical protein